MRHTPALALCATLLTACATPLSPEQMAAADYGPPPPPHYEDIVKAEFAGVLVDPTSPIYSFKPLRKGYYRPPSEAPIFGWIVCGTYNSKNRMGGYSGNAPFFAVLRGDRVASFVPGDSRRISGANIVIKDVCGDAFP